MEEQGPQEQRKMHKLDLPEAQIEGFYDKSGLFDHVRGIQSSLDLQRFDSYVEANGVAQDLIKELDGLARHEQMLGKVTTLIGRDVMMPVTFYADGGGVGLRLEQAYDNPQKIKDVTGEFYGFCCYAIGEAHSGRFRPVLGFSVKLRPVFTPGFDGTLTAYGPVESTSVDFIDDEIKREFGPYIAPKFD